MGAYIRLKANRRLATDYDNALHNTWGRPPECIEEGAVSTNPTLQVQTLSAEAPTMLIQCSKRSVFT